VQNWQKKTLSMRKEIVSQVDNALLDPLTSRPRFGGWSGLVEELLTQWLQGKIITSERPPLVDLGDLNGQQNNS
jgi:hypothetical protein